MPKRSADVLALLDPPGRRTALLDSQTEFTAEKGSCPPFLALVPLDALKERIGQFI